MAIYFNAYKRKIGDKVTDIEQYNIWIDQDPIFKEHIATSEAMDAGENYAFTIRLEGDDIQKYDITKGVDKVNPLDTFYSRIN